VRILLPAAALAAAGGCWVLSGAGPGPTPGADAFADSSYSLPEEATTPNSASNGLCAWGIPAAVQLSAAGSRLGGGDTAAWLLLRALGCRPHTAAGCYLYLCSSMMPEASAFHSPTLQCGAA